MSVPGMVAPESVGDDRPAGRALSPNELLARRLTNLALSHQRTTRSPARAAPRAFNSASEYASVAMEDNGISPVRLGRFAQISPLAATATAAALATAATVGPGEDEWPAPPLERPWERLIERQTLRPTPRERSWQTLVERYGSNVVLTRTAMVAGVILLSVVLVSAVCQVARTAEGATIVPRAIATATPAAVDPDAAGAVAPPQSQRMSADGVRQALNTALASANAAVPTNAGTVGSGWGAATSNAAGSPSSWGSANAPAQGAAVPPVVIPPGAVAIWPVTGPITSFFGPSHPLGIDIGVNTGTPIRAMAAGVVTFSGGDPCCSYGYYVDIDHGNGVMTRYGHMVVPSWLRPGQQVRIGDVIGYSGSTGFSTGPHVHFEVRFHGVPVNPLLVLPG